MNSDSPLLKRISLTTESIKFGDFFTSSKEIKKASRLISIS